MKEKLINRWLELRSKEHVNAYPQVFSQEVKEIQRIYCILVKRYQMPFPAAPAQS